MSVGDLCRRIYCRWGPRGIQTAGCRCAVLTARVTVGSGSSAGVAAAARPPRAAVEPHPAVGSRHGRPGIACAGGGREIRRRKPRLHLRRGTGEVGARKGRRWRRLGRVHGPASDALECEKRETRAWTQGAVGLVQGARGRVRSSSGPQRWIGCGVGEVRSGRARGGKGGGVGPVAEPRTAVKSRGCRWRPLSVTAGAGTGTRRE